MERSNLDLVTVYKLVEWLGVCLAHQKTNPIKFLWGAAPNQPSWTQINFQIFAHLVLLFYSLLSTVFLSLVEVTLLFNIYAFSPWNARSFVYFLIFSLQII